MGNINSKKPFNNITSAVELSLKVHQGVRPDINLLPKGCPVVIRNMIERCWDIKRENRLSDLNCCIILQECFNLLTILEHDVYLIYKKDTSKHREILINYIRSTLKENGFKVISSNEYEGQDFMNERYELIKRSKVILLFLEETTQTDWNVKLELGNNRGFKRPRPVIPFFIESRNDNFPDNEIQAHCFLGKSDTRVFDIWKFIKKSNIADVYNSIQDIKLQDAEFGIDPLDLELINLVDYIHELIHNLILV